MILQEAFQLNHEGQHQECLRWMTVPHIGFIKKNQMTFSPSFQ
jgi:hypothetical protein